MKMPSLRVIGAVSSLLICGWCTGADSSIEEQPVTRISASLGEYTTITQQVKPFRPISYLQKQLPGLPEPNAAVVKMMLSYPRGGQHDYWWPKRGEAQYDGSTTDVMVGGVRAMKGEAKGRTFCCGLTLEVFLRTLGNEGKIAPVMTSDTLPIVKRLWFCDQLYSPGPEDALLGFGMGKRIDNPEEAKPGDFVQIWRNDRSGHSVIFVAWAYDPQGHRVGLHYWSTQPKTNGIAFNSELFGDREKTIDEKKLSITRLLPREQWRDISVEELEERFGK